MIPRVPSECRSNQEREYQSRICKNLRGINLGDDLPYTISYLGGLCSSSNFPPRNCLIWSSARV